jgi:putative aldouronate transport system substrate-binding protein
MMGVGAVAVGSPLLASCGSSSSPAATGKANNTAGLKAVLPDYVPGTGGPTPDLPSVTGTASASSDPAFLTYPTTPVKTVTAVPGSGGSYTAITPLWGSIPAAGNPYYQAVNKALGANLTVQPANGNDYAQTVPTLVAGNKLPHWLQIPTWWNANLNVGELAVSKFADLTSYLSGSNIRKYPNLAAIPTGGWQAGAWNNKLYGIPSYTSGASFAGILYYRKDIFDAKGIDPSTVKDADTLFALGKELTAPSANVWGFDVIWLMIQQIFKVPPTGADITIQGGKVVSAFDTPELEAALNYAYKLAKSGYVHPDGLANQNSQGKQRFYSGHVLISSDGPGAWNAADAIQGRSSNPKFERGAFKIFSNDGSTPTIALGSSASLMSYLNKSLSAAQIQECLAIANYLAAPFGSAEYTLINYGIEGTDWTMTATGPTYTTTGTKESNQSTYQFLASPRSVTTNPGYDNVTKAIAAWAGDAVQHAYKPPFWNLNVATPSRFSSTSTATQVNDIIQEVTFGTKTVADFKTAAANWKSSGGQALIDWYQKNVLDVYGSGQS